jgi:hypothetical protein
MIWTFYVNIGIRLLLFLVEIVLRLLPVGWNRVRVLNDVFVSERGEGSELCPLLLEKGWLKTITKSGKRPGRRSSKPSDDRYRAPQRDIPVSKNAPMPALG